MLVTGSYCLRMLSTFFLKTRIDSTGSAKTKRTNNAVNFNVWEPIKWTYLETCAWNLCILHRFHDRLASFLWALTSSVDPDQTPGVWSGSAMFVYRMFFTNSNKNDKYHQRPIEMGNGLVQLVSVGCSTRLKWVYNISIGCSSRIEISSTWSMYFSTLK